jgi:hypothetical protein
MRYGGPRAGSAEVLAQGLSLALAGSIYPPAVAAVIALGRGPQVRSRVFAFVFAALLVTYADGVALLFLFDELDVSSPQQPTPGAAIDIALGVALVALAIYLRRKRPTAPERGKTSRVERYLQSRRLAFLLGVTLYILPSPIYVAAVLEASRAASSPGGELLALAAIVVVMLWLIEVPMLMLLAAPASAAGALERVNRWFAAHGRLIAVLACLAAGVYLVVKGVLDLAG